MNSAIGEVAVASVGTEVANKKPSHAASSTRIATEITENERSFKGADEEIHADGINQPDRKNAEQETVRTSLGEIRKIEVKDGETKTKVYDHSGKLLRVIPPGYVPAGEPKFDVTV